MYHLTRHAVRACSRPLSHHALSHLHRRTFSSVQLSPLLSTPLKEIDPDIYTIIRHETDRQRDSLALIPSENFTSVSVLESLGSVMQNKYSEGYPGARYYGGNEFIDQAESLCQQRALDVYKLNTSDWGVNVQPHSGSPANFYVYTALLQPHDRIMSLDLPHGGHLSHGYQIPNKNISAVSKYFTVLPYRLNESTGLIDYDTLAANAKLFRPKLIVAGASAYSRHIDYARMRQIADSVNAYLLVDMAHISGLIAAGVMPSPFEHADVVTTTTHKSLRGPRGAMIFYRKGTRTIPPATSKGKPQTVEYDLAERINAAVFPGHQGGPHNHTITALAVALKQAQTSDFKEYQKQVLLNSQALTQAMIDLKYKLVSGGTDNHLCLVDVRPNKLTGSKVETVLERVNIALNKNTVPGDVSAMNPGGIRMGSPALTTRGFVEKDMRAVAEFVHRGVEIAKEVQEVSGPKIVDFKKVLDEKPSQKLLQLKDDVVKFARQFPAVAPHNAQ